MTQRIEAIGSRFNTLALLCSVGMVALTSVLPIRHDYSRYLLHWEDVLAGGNPWLPGPGRNAYGPLYNLLAFPMTFHVLAPRILFVLAWIGCCYLVTAQLRVSSVARMTALQQRGWVVVALFGSPIGWLMTVRYGIFDSLVVLFCLACIVWHRRHPWAAGALLAAGCCLKMYPAVLLPFVGYVRDDGDHERLVTAWWQRLNGRLIMSFVLVSLLICAMAVAVWGDAPLGALRFAGDRPSKLLSIFRFLDGRYSPLQAIGLGGITTARASIFCVVGSVVLLSLLHLRRPFEVVTGCACVMLCIAITYKVGHLQFRVLPVTLVVWLLLREVWPRRVMHFGIAFVAWNALVLWGYPCFSFYKNGFAWMREILGLPTFAIELGLLMSFLCEWIRKPVPGELPSLAELRWFF